MLLVEQPSKFKAKQQAVLVVGMHRSGTSAVTRMLNLLGAELSDNLLGAAAGNDLGHWEQMDALRLHEEMLKSAGAAWDDIFGVEPGWFHSPAARHYADALTDLIRTRFPGAPLFAVKDPRMALFVPVWVEALRVLDITPRFVLPFRHPAEVEASLRTRHLHGWKMEWPAGQGELLWLRHVLAAERATRGHLRSFVPFDALLADWKREAKRMAAQLDLAWPRQSRDAKMEIGRFLDRQHKHETVAFGGAPAEELTWPARVFEQLSACVRDPQAGAELFDRAAQSLSEATGLFGDYVAYLRNQSAQVPPLREELTRVGPALEEARTTLATRDRALAETQAALAQAQAAASGRDRELAQAGNELAARERAIAELRQSLATRDRALAESEAALAQAQAIVSGRDQELAQAGNEVSGRDRALAQEAERHTAEIAAAREALRFRQADAAEQAEWAALLESELESERERLSEQLAEAWGEIERWQALAEEERQRAERTEAGLRSEQQALACALADAKEAIAVTEAELARSTDELTRREQEAQARAAELAQAQQARAAAEAELAQAKERLSATEARLNERFGEIATLTRLLRERESAAREAAGRADWGRRTAAAFIGGGGTWRGRLIWLLPGPLAYALRKIQLQRRGLFDGQAYLRANPDVARAGADPLRHYLNHGLPEGRRRD